MEQSIRAWYGECMRKKKLRESWADQVIVRAEKTGQKLYKYYCNHCQHWHVTKQAKRS